MPKCGLKLKAISKPRHNLYSYRLPGPFLGSSKDFFGAAKGQDSEDEAIDDNVAIDDIRRRSWTREQKLGAIKYATSTYVPGKTGSNELIPNNAAALKIGCTPKMLRTWIQTYDEINASSKGSWKNRRNTTLKEPEMEQELHKLFIQKQSTRRKINAK
jgi:transposase-like protein